MYLIRSTAYDRIESPSALDLIVRTPQILDWRLKEGDWFFREIVERAKALDGEIDGRLDAKR